MGWILTKPKTSNRSSKSTAQKGRKATTQTGARNDKHDGRHGIAAMRLFLSLMLIALGGWGWHQAEHHLANYWEEGQSMGEMPPKRLKLVNRPDWMSEDIVTELENAALSHLPNTLLSKQSLASVERSLLQNAWIKKIKMLNRSAEGLMLDADFREPVALVAEPSHFSGQTHYHAVDADGIRLPASSSSLDNLDHWPLIVGTKYQPGRLGEPWPGEGVWSGLKLMRYLVNQPYWSQVKAIDIGMHDLSDRPLLILLTDKKVAVDWPNRLADADTSAASLAIKNGMEHTGRKGVIWGPPPGMEEPVEPRATQKVERIMLVFEHYDGHVDGRGRIVDLTGLRGPQVYSIVNEAVAASDA